MLLASRHSLAMVYEEIEMVKLTEFPVGRPHLRWINVTLIAFSIRLWLKSLSGRLYKVIIAYSSEPQK